MSHHGVVGYAEFSPDGLRVVTASFDQTARVWDVRTGRPISLPMRHHGSLRHAGFSPDGRHVVTASDDQTARIWDATTGQPVTPLLRHQGVVSDARFSPDGSRVVTAGSDGMARVWEFVAPRPLAGPDDPLPALARLVAGREIGAQGELVVIDPSALQSTSQALRSRDPPAFLTPPGKVRTWHQLEARDCVQRQLWQEARNHYDAIIEANPRLWHDRMLRGRVLAVLGLWGEAAADFAQAIDLGANATEVWAQLATLQLQSDDLSGYRRTCESILRRFGQTREPATADVVALTCGLAPCALGDPAEPVALIERSQEHHSRNYGFGRTAYGIALYRADRLGDAVRWLSPDGTIPGRLFLGMAHHRLGHRDEAQRCLEDVARRIDQAEHGASPNPVGVDLAGILSRQWLVEPPSWVQQLSLRILRSEAESLLNAPGR
jgi:tetratricopeptide (TPR) repeat protein